MLSERYHQGSAKYLEEDEEAAHSLLTDNDDLSPRFQENSAGRASSIASTSRISQSPKGRNAFTDLDPGRPQRTPLPRFQMFVLCILRLSEPIAYTQIFPYINQMVENMNVTNNRQEIGYYSGIVDSMFAIFQLFTILYWGRLSDRIGRKPVILMGLSGVAISTFLFGLSRTFLWTILSRSLAGALSGNAAVTNSVVSEITDETNQMDAFPLMALAWSLGCVIGPLIGGNLSNPESNFPRAFGSIEIFRNYPYFLPCLVSALITAVTVVIGFLYLNESLPTRSQSRSPKKSEITDDKYKEETSIINILSSRNIRYIFINYFLLSVCGISFDVIFILLAYTPVQFGGLSRSPREIGLALAFSGIAGSVLQVFVFPRLYRRFPSTPLYSSLTMMWPIAFVFLPYLSAIARQTAPVGVSTSVSSADVGQATANEITGRYPASFALWFWITITLTILRCGHMCYSLNTILIRNASPSQEALGATFGLAQTVACVARAGAPAFASSLFAISIQHKLLGGNLIWVIMFVIALCTWCSAFFVSNGMKPGFTRSSEGYALLSIHASDSSRDSLDEEMHQHT